MQVAEWQVCAEPRRNQQAVAGAHGFVCFLFLSGADLTMAGRWTCKGGLQQSGSTTRDGGLFRGRWALLGAGQWALCGLR